MSKTTSIQATAIKQPLAGKRIQNSKGKNIKSPSVCRDGDANPSYHPWEANSLNNFIKGKEIQCGRKSTYHCNLKTVKWIKGYRNTCPIAGCCGTFNRPAPLELHNFNFSKKNITKKIKIQSFTIEYKHHGVGVDVSVGTGSIHKNWMGVFPYVDLYLYNGNKLIQKKRFDKKVPLAKNQTVKITFDKDFVYNPKTDNLWIEINYAGNGGGEYSTQATNPSIIYAKSLKMSMKYDFVDKPKVTPKSSLDIDVLDNTLITDKRNPNNPPGDENCRTTVEQTINFYNTSANKVKIKTLPTGVKNISTSIENNSKTFEFQDVSGMAGEKKIIYHIEGAKTQLSTSIVAKNYKNPDIDIITSYVKNQKYNNETFIDIGDGCWSTMDLYIDKLTSSPLIHLTKDESFNQEEYLDYINLLSCGYHTIFIYLNGNKYITKEIVIRSPVITFSTTVEGPYDVDEDIGVDIEIQRTDSNDLNNPVTVKISDQSTPSVLTTYNFESKEIHDYTISLENPGTFDILAEYNDGCSDKQQIIGTFVVKPTHIQSYDELLIETNNTHIEYDSLIVREGDRLDIPVTYTDASFMNDFFEEDFIIYAKDGHTNIGELGYGILAIKNIQADTIKNLCIELNPFKKSTDALTDDLYDPLPSEWQTGMLQSFYNNFYNLNPNVSTIIEIYNIQNQDLINEGTENVILKIDEIKTNKTIELKIPFFNHYEKEIYMNFLLLGEICEAVDLEKYTSNQTAYSKPIESVRENYLSKERGEQSYIKLNVSDLRTAELSIEGDDLDRNSNNNDYLDIIYKLKIPESECDDSIKLSNVNTQIINDFNLKPVQYSIGNNPKQNFSTNDNKVSLASEIQSQYVPMVSENIWLEYDINGNTHYMREVTDINGEVTFSFVIPAEFGKDTFYLDDILQKITISYKGDSFHNPVNLNPGYSMTGTKTNTRLSSVKNYNKYKAEQNIPITIRLTEQSKTYKNIINIHNDIEYCSQTIHIYYESCPNKINDKGFKTIFKTNSDQLVDNQVEAMIYCNVPTDLEISGKLQKRLLENHNTNVLTLIAHNGYKPNKNVYIRASIGPENERTGDYLALTAVNIDKKEYSYDQGLDIILWDIGNMDSYETKTCDVILESEQVGHNTIYISGYDYLNHFEQEVIFTQLNITSNPSEDSQLYIDDIINLKVTPTNAKNNKTLFGEVTFKQGLIKDTNLQPEISQVKNKQQEGMNLEQALKDLYKDENNADRYIEDFLETHQNNQLGESYIREALVYIRKETVKNMVGMYNALHDNQYQNYNINEQVNDIRNEITSSDYTDNANSVYRIWQSNIIDKEIMSNDSEINELADILYDEFNEFNIPKKIITKYIGKSSPNQDKLKNIYKTLAFVVFLFNYNQDASKNITYSEITELLSLFEYDLNTIKQYADDVAKGYKNIWMSSLLDKIKAMLYVKTIAINHVSLLNGEYYSNAHVKARGHTIYLWGEYKASKTHLTNYIESTSKILSFEDVKKYDLNVDNGGFALTPDTDFKTNENINVTISLKHENTGYFDRDLDIRFYVNNEEIINTSYEDGKYIANFVRGQPGTYDIKVYIPETDKVEPKVFKKTITIYESAGE